MRMLRWCLLALLFPLAASARLSSMNIDHLIVYSDEIVLAKVTELLPSSAAERDVVFATVSVEKTYKGSLRGSFLLRASPGVICDSSMAIKDETALFFLNRGDDGIYYIQFAGRGRMPLRQVNGRTYASLWSEVLLPKDAPTIAGPDAQSSYVSSVELGYLEALIRKYRDRKPVYSGPEAVISDAAR